MYRPNPLSILLIGLNAQRGLKLFKLLSTLFLIWKALAYKYIRVHNTSPSNVSAMFRPPAIRSYNIADTFFWT